MEILVASTETISEHLGVDCLRVELAAAIATSNRVVCFQVRVITFWEELTCSLLYLLQDSFLVLYSLLT